MKQQSTLLLSILFLLCALCAGAQNFHCTPLPNQALLPVPKISHVLQDQEGYMWYGTQGGGVCRDDGYQLQTWASGQHKDKAIENDEVTALAEDSRLGRIWVGTRGGLYYIDKRKGTAHAIDTEEARHKKIHCLAVRADGSLWFGVEHKVVLLSPQLKVVKSFSIGENPREEPKSMMIDHKGTLWVCILRGGLRTVDKEAKRLVDRPWTLDKAANYIVEDTLNHCYWVGTWGKGIVSYPDMTVHPATLHTDGNNLFGCEVNNLVIDYKRGLLWTSTVDNLYAYRIVSVLGTDNRPICTLLPLQTADFMSQEKKIIGNLYLDKYNNVWVPGSMPRTFIISAHKGWGTIRRDPVQAMTQQIGYKPMVSRIVREGTHYWIYQDRTRLSLYDSQTGALSFMATEAQPTPLSTNKALARCREAKGVWTCSGRKLLHVWNEGPSIHWKEQTDLQPLPNYIASLNDVGGGKLLIGTEKQVFLYNYHTHTTTQLTDSVGTVHSCGYDSKGQLQYSLRPGQPLPLTDRHGHTWQLTETSLVETSTRTGASRTIRPADPDVQMEYFTDISLTDDSICLGGIGAFCIIGHSPALDHPDSTATRIVKTDERHLSTLNPLMAHSLQFAYRIVGDTAWTYLPAGINTIDPEHLPGGTHTLEAMVTDPFGRWSQPQPVGTVTGTPSAWRHSLWLILLLCLAIGGYLWRRKKKSEDVAETDVPPTPPVTLPATELPDNLPHNEVKEEKAVPPSPFLQQVTELINQNLDKPEYGIEELCADLSISRMNLYRKFQNVSVQTPSEYIRTLRLRRGAELLRTTELSVSEIAYTVGFTSPQYFTKCFREEYGMTPKKYQKAPNP